MTRLFPRNVSPFYYQALWGKCEYRKDTHGVCWTPRVDDTPIEGRRLTPLSVRHISSGRRRFPLLCRPLLPVRTAKSPLRAGRDRDNICPAFYSRLRGNRGGVRERASLVEDNPDYELLMLLALAKNGWPASGRGPLRVEALAYLFSPVTPGDRQRDAAPIRLTQAPGSTVIGCSPRARRRGARACARGI